jgi:magnesium transporter
LHRCFVAQRSITSPRRSLCARHAVPSAHPEFRELLQEGNLEDLLKELVVSFALAFVLAGIAFGNALLLLWIGGKGDGTPKMFKTAGVIGLAMAADVVCAAVLGAAIPSLVKWMRIDPALISTPAVTALTDLTGAGIFLMVVTMLL